MTASRDLVSPLLGPVQTAAEVLARAEAMALLRSCTCGIDRDECIAEQVDAEGSGPHDERLARTCPCCRGHHDLRSVEVGSAIECPCGAHLFVAHHELLMSEEGECGECDEVIRYMPDADLADFATLRCEHCGELAALMCGLCHELGVRPVGADDVHPRCGDAEREMRRRDELELVYGHDTGDADEDGTWSGRELAL